MGKGEAAMFQVLGAIAYGEHKAYDEAMAKAEAATDEAARRTWRVTAAEELRHHKGFVRRLQALGADPERAMRPYRAALDSYHRGVAGDEVSAAVQSFLGEGIANDLMRWLREVSDPETAAFVDTVLADEEGHEARATDELRAMLQGHPGRRLQAFGASMQMLAHMLRSGTFGGSNLARFGAFLRVGRGLSLLRIVTDGYRRRVAAIGLLGG